MTTPNPEWRELFPDDEADWQALFRLLETPTEKKPEDVK